MVSVRLPALTPAKSTLTVCPASTESGTSRPAKLTVTERLFWVLELVTRNRKLAALGTLTLQVLLFPFEIAPTFVLTTPGAVTPPVGGGVVPTLATLKR